MILELASPSRTSASSPQTGALEAGGRHRADAAAPPPAAGWPSIVIPPGLWIAIHQRGGPLIDTRTPWGRGGSEVVRVRDQGAPPRDHSRWRRGRGTHHAQQQIPGAAADFCREFPARGTGLGQGQGPESTTAAQPKRQGGGGPSIEDLSGPAEVLLRPETSAQNPSPGKPGLLGVRPEGLFSKSQWSLDLPGRSLHAGNFGPPQWEAWAWRGLKASRSGQRSRPNGFPTGFKRRASFAGPITK